MLAGYISTAGISTTKFPGPKVAIIKEGLEPPGVKPAFVSGFQITQ